MEKKQKTKQKNHDEAVQMLADQLKKDNWEVETNKKGSEKPFKIGRFTPDIIAKKGGLKQICQILTKKDFIGDKQRYIEFKNYCNNYDFHFYVISKDGKRLQIDPNTIGDK